MELARRMTCEALGSAFLLAAIIGSGIMGARLAQGNDAVTLLANTLSTGAMLYVLILVFGPLSGAHFNPAVTLWAAWSKRLSGRQAAAYIAAQIAGALAGVASAHIMFGEAVFSLSQHVRSGGAQWFSEGIATFGLLMVIICISRLREPAVPAAVAAYISSAYWFTSSTSFANPAVTIARAMSDSFSGIRPQDAPGFIAAQLAGAAAAAVIFPWLLKEKSV